MDSADEIRRALIAGLFLWSLLSLGTATAGLYARPGETMRAFWFMSALWGLIDGLIALYALLADPQTPAQLLPIFRFNAGLDGLYIAAGAGIASRKGPRARGFGLAVIVQGVFLLMFDGYFWWRCARVIVG